MNANRVHGRIGFYSTTATWGGSELYLQQVLEERSRRGLASVLFTRPAYRLVREDRLPPGCEAVFAPLDDEVAPLMDAGVAKAAPDTAGAGASWRDLVPGGVKIAAGALRDIAGLTAFFRRQPVDVIHFNDTGCEPGVIAARLAGIPRITGTLHALPGCGPGEADPVHRAIEHASLRCMDVAIAVSRFTRHAWLDRTHVDAARVRVIYNGIDVDAFRPMRPAAEVRRELAIAPDAPVIGVTARLHPMKGHRYLVQALPAVAARVPKLAVVFAGEGPLRAELTAMVARLGLDDCVRFLGHRTDVADLTQVYDIAALPSISLECLPYTPMEAMALGKPVVASHFSGIPEVVEDGVTGTLVTPRRPRELAAALIELLTHPDRSRAFGEAGRERVRRVFSLDRMCRETFALHDELLGAARRRRGRAT